MSFIEVKNVKFRYPQTKKDALGGIELSIETVSYTHLTLPTIA